MKSYPCRLQNVIQPGVMETDSPHPETSRIIIGCAMTVLNTLRPGLDERLYENALVIELESRGLKVEQ